MASDQTVLSFDRVVKKYRATVAVDGLSFDVRRGEMFGLIGPDGAGKTTSIRLLCGLLRPDGGAIRVVGRDPVKEHRAITGSVGYLSQRFSALRRSHASTRTSRSLPRFTASPITRRGATSCSR